MPRRRRHRQGWHATVAPLTTDVHLAGSDTVVVEASSSPLQVPTAVWLSAATMVPLAAFARELGAFTQLGTGTLGHALRALRTSGDIGDSAPHGVAGLERDVDTLELVDALQTSLAWFASADRALTDIFEKPVVSGEGLDVPVLVAWLVCRSTQPAGVTKGELLQVLRGEPLSDAQATALAPILHLEAQALRSDPAVPEAPIQEASSPRWFTPRLAFYAAEDLSDEEGLPTLAHKAQFAFAARSVFAAGTTAGARESPTYSTITGIPSPRMTARTQAARLADAVAAHVQRRSISGISRRIHSGCCAILASISIWFILRAFQRDAPLPQRMTVTHTHPNKGVR